MPSPYKVAIFDMDGVIFEKPTISSRDDIVASSSWDSVFDELGIYDLHERLRDIYVKRGFKSYLDWSEAALCVLKAAGLTEKGFNKVIDSRVFMPGAEETFKELRSKKIVTGIVSGSFGAIAQKAQKKLGIDYVLAHCDLDFDDKGMLRDWKLLATDYKDKLKFVKYIAQINQATLKECIYVGDDINDTTVFQRVGLAIAFNCQKQKVLEKANVAIKEKDLSAILPHIGIEPQSAARRASRGVSGP